jgi:predicted nucleic acid-binding protein
VNLVDSSGWIEFFTGGPLTARFEPFLADETEVVTPTIVLYEVYKLVRRERGVDDAARAAAALQRTSVVPLTGFIALTAAELSLDLGLAMADAIVYATARLHDINVVTSDEDFEHLPGVTYFGKNKKRPRQV